MSLFFDLIFILTILVLISINLKTMLLPNAIIFPGFVIFLFARIFLVIIDANNLEVKPLQLFSSPITATIFDSLIGVAIGSGTLWIVNNIWYRIREVEVVGFGDIKMMAMIGAYLGILNTIGVLLIGMILGAICGILLEKISRSKYIVLPSGFLWGIPAIFFALISIDQIIVRLGR